MSPYPIALALALVALIAYYSAKDGHQIDVDRGVKVFLFLTTAMGFGLYGHGAYVKDQRFSELFEITHSVAMVAESCRVGVDSTLATLKTFEKLLPAGQP